MFDLFKSPVAGGIALGLGISCCWLIPLAIAYLTDTGIAGFAGTTVVMLVLAAAVAEYRARKRAA